MSTVIFWPKSPPAWPMAPVSAVVMLPSSSIEISVLLAAKIVILKLNWVCLGPTSAVAVPEPTFEPFGQDWTPSLLILVAGQKRKPLPETFVFFGRRNTIWSAVLLLSLL